MWDILRIFGKAVRDGSTEDSGVLDGTAYIPVVTANGRLYKALETRFPSLIGNQTLAGVKTFSSMFKIPINTPVAGAGTVIGDAAALSTGFTVITGANGTVGWILPVTTGGDVVIIKGTTAGVAKLWPQSGGQINAVGTSTAMSLASGVIPAILISISATQWYTIPLLPS